MSEQPVFEIDGEVRAFKDGRVEWYSWTAQRWEVEEPETSICRAVLKANGIEVPEEARDADS